MNYSLDLSNVVGDFINSKNTEILDNPELVDLHNLFKNNFEAFERLLDFYKQNTRYKRVSKESGVGEIKKLLVQAGVIKTEEDITTAYVLNTMSRLRAEKKGKKSIKGRKQNSNFHSSVVDLAPQEGARQTVEETVTPPSLRDWLDPEWLDEEPDWKQWAIEKKKPEPGEWSDEWENMWRHLLKIADERGFNEFQKKSYEGYKQLGSVFADLWLAMNRSRRDLKDQYGWDAYGVGKKVAE